MSGNRARKRAARKFLILAPDELLSKAQVASVLGIHRATLEKWIATGKFPPPIVLSKRTIRWSPKTVTSWIARCARGAAK